MLASSSIPDNNLQPKLPFSSSFLFISLVFFTVLLLSTITFSIVIMTSLLKNKSTISPTHSSNSQTVVLNNISNVLTSSHSDCMVNTLAYAQAQFLASPDDFSTNAKKNLVSWKPAHRRPLWLVFHYNYPQTRVTSGLPFFCLCTSWFLQQGQGSGYSLHLLLRTQEGIHVPGWLQSSILCSTGQTPGHLIRILQFLCAWIKSRSPLLSLPPQSYYQSGTPHQRGVQMELSENSLLTLGTRLQSCSLPCTRVSKQEEPCSSPSWDGAAPWWWFPPHLQRDSLPLYHESLLLLWRQRTLCLFLSQLQTSFSCQHSQ